MFMSRKQYGTSPSVISLEISSLLVFQGLLLYLNVSLHFSNYQSADVNNMRIILALLMLNRYVCFGIANNCFHVYEHIQQSIAHIFSKDSRILCIKGHQIPNPQIPNGIYHIFYLNRLVSMSSQWGVSIFCPHRDFPDLVLWHTLPGLSLHTRWIPISSGEWGDPIFPSLRPEPAATNGDDVDKSMGAGAHLLTESTPRLSNRRPTFLPSLLRIFACSRTQHGVREKEGRGTRGCMGAREWGACICLLLRLWMC